MLLTQAASPADISPPEPIIDLRILLASAVELGPEYHRIAISGITFLEIFFVSLISTANCHIRQELVIFCYVACFIYITQHARAGAAQNVLP
jgi:hypothetical protein